MNRFLSSRRVLLFAAAGGVIGRFPALPAALERLPAKVDGHGSNLMAKITLPGGTSRSVTLQGVGCPAAMCSRVAIKGDAAGHEEESVWIDTIAAIRDTTEHSALFVMRDGSERRWSLLHDFRVLYFVDRSGRPERVDLAHVGSVEF
ncbi:MAG TPA: hypothetical protein VN841_20640 [Bryobacteraceae bacterium]|nr:hypothetical protein [Bryobacteraceae bacterium]